MVCVISFLLPAFIPSLLDPTFSLTLKKKMQKNSISFPQRSNMVCVYLWFLHITKVFRKIKQYWGVELRAECPWIGCNIPQIECLFLWNVINRNHHLSNGSSIWRNCYQYSILCIWLKNDDRNRARKFI